MSRSHDQRPPAPPLPQQWRHSADDPGAGAPPPQGYNPGWPPQHPQPGQHPHQAQAAAYVPPGYPQQPPAQPPPFAPQPPVMPQQAAPVQPRAAPFPQQQDPRSQPAQWPPVAQPVSHQQPPPAPHQPPAYAAPPMPARDPAGFDAFAQTVGRTAPPPPPPFPPGGPERARAERMRADQLRQDQLRQDQLRQQPARHAHEADGYDLSSYAVPPPAADPRYGAPPPQAQWRDGGGYAPAGHAQVQAYDGDFGRRGPHAQGPAGQPPAQYGTANDEVEYEEPRRSRRWLIVGALMGSIVVGGGMAYGYKMLVSDKGGSGKTQVVKAPRDPAKTAPDDRGGKRFANTDNKFMNRVPSDGGVAGEQDGSGVRRVQTVTVGKDMATGPTTSPPLAGAVPGMTIVGADGMPSAGLPPLPPTMAPSAVQSPVRSAAPPQPSAGGAPRVAAAPPPPAPPRPPVARPAPIETPIDSAPPPPRQPVARAAPPPPAGAGAGTEPPPAGSAAAKVRPTTGYVAVLGFQRTQVEAMRMMADLQQKYDVLRDKRLDIVSSDQSARGLGVIYRVVVGPPGRIDAAKGTCAELAKAGHPAGSCYPLAN